MDYPTETTAAITTGIAAAQAGALLRQVTVAQSLDKQDPVVCVSGGAWPLVAAEVRRALPSVEIHEIPHVVLHGLAVLATRVALVGKEG
jgi:type III pantothenate kinase